MQETSDCINIDPALPIYNYACGYEILDIFRSCLILPGGPDYRAQTLADITECRASGGGNPDEEELAQWRNWAAFLARLAVRDVESLCYGIWIIRKALEGGVRSENQNTPIVKGDSLHTRLCGVRDWLNIAGPRILQLLLVSAGNGTAVDDMAARTCEPGRLCGDAVPAFGVERWSFWKQRLGEMSGPSLPSWSWMRKIRFRCAMRCSRLWGGSNRRQGLFKETSRHKEEL
ncbi:hypothetical protein MGG_13814 [Pyricularia oryzae 70-15]|uniref:Uncharacterized protein n=2 Tax=Pyricularia oryzae TaxID=318829 RepID=G4MSA8_PYRO7|nr:uncharacterized protein MGG_13814 [Pyricularia oryzae 70-15]EHA58366.1 hypothetical protein MGG_13814 [Pyricularia oryzae 70-15]